MIEQLMRNEIVIELVDCVLPARLVKHASMAVGRGMRLTI